MAASVRLMITTLGLLVADTYLATRAFDFPSMASIASCSPSARFGEAWRLFEGGEYATSFDS